MEGTFNVLFAIGVFNLIHSTKGTEIRENYWSQNTDAFSGLPLEMRSQHNVSSAIECAGISGALESSFYAFSTNESEQANCILLSSLSVLSSSSSVWLNEEDAWTIYRRPNVQEFVRVIAFRFSTDIGMKLHSFYEEGESSPLSRFPEAYDRSTSLGTPFKSEELLSLGRDDIVQIRIQMWKSGETVVDVAFNATGRGKNDWFKYTNLIQSQWSDFTRTLVTGFIEYDSNENRYFTAQKSGGGCVDIGWFVVVDGFDTCAWGAFSSFPKFIFSTQTTAQLYTFGDLADDFVIMVDLEI